ncbi:hypothetical protein [Rhodococcus jostii]|uniref:hypothetical protein n=1 Tax=Rhodococcus jostii TaxID=132919 RepID=UPI003627CABE
MATSTMNRRYRLRKLAYAPLVAAVATGAICTGAGVGLAATTDAPQSGGWYNWQLVNRTGQPIYGTWGAETASGDKSRVETDKDHPWKPGDASAKATQYQGWTRTSWSGDICFNHRSWRYASERVTADRVQFSLEADSTGALFVYPHGHNGESPDRLVFDTQSFC